MLAEKQMLTLDELDAQSAVELPQRDTLLVTVVLSNVRIIRDVTITVEDVNVALQICAAVLAQDTGVTCEVIQ